MKRKELKNLATKIAKLETVIHTSWNEKEIAQAQEEIIKLTSHVKSFEDLEIIDEMVMELLSKEKKES